MMRAWLQHRLNSGHLFCRLRDLGVPREAARCWSARLSRIFNLFLYGRSS